MESFWKFVDEFLLWIKFCSSFWMKFGWEMSWKVCWMICMSSVESFEISWTNSVKSFSEVLG